jgi:hypothetical protein
MLSSTLPDVLARYNILAIIVYYIDLKLLKSIEDEEQKETHKYFLEGYPSFKDFIDFLGIHLLRICFHLILPLRSLKV